MRSLFAPHGVYNGAVVFKDGVHYPVGHEGSRRHRLMWDAATETYAYWDGQGGSHQLRYHRNEVELNPGG